MGLVGDFLSDKFVPRDERVRLFRTWGSGLGMLPIGGTAAWGNATWAPDDTPEMVERNLTYGCAPAVTPFNVAERRKAVLQERLRPGHAAQQQHSRMAQHTPRPNDMPQRVAMLPHIALSLRWHQ